MTTVTTTRTSAEARPSATPRRTALRLTRRGRVLVLLFAVALLLGAFAFGRSASHAAEVSEPMPLLTQTTVLPGDSLWSIAQRVAPRRDPRQVIDQLRQLNQLPSPVALRAGQLLLLPAER